MLRSAGTSRPRGLVALGLVLSLAGSAFVLWNRSRETVSPEEVLQRISSYESSYEAIHAEFDKTQDQFAIVAMTYLKRLDPATQATVRQKLDAYRSELSQAREQFQVLHLQNIAALRANDLALSKTLAERANTFILDLQIGENALHARGSWGTRGDRLLFPPYALPDEFTARDLSPPLRRAEARETERSPADVQLAP
jgi:hypothetical protein